MASSQSSSAPETPARDRSQAASSETDFARVLELIASDPAFERALLEDPVEALRAFSLDPDEITVLRQYRRWRIPF